MPETLKKIGYPVAVSKSTFQTLGTKHSWPHVLGVLHYLTGRASRIFRLRTGLARAQVFPGEEDEQGFGFKNAASDEGIMFQHFVDCYEAFNAGKDEFHEELDQLREQFEVGKGINRKELRALERKRERCVEELQKLESEPGRFEEKAKAYRNLSDDLGIVKKHREEIKAFVEKRQSEVRAVTARIAELESGKEDALGSLEQANAAAKARGAGAGGDGERAQQEERMGDLRRQLLGMREANSETEKKCWAAELANKKCRDRLDAMAQAYNSGLARMNLGEGEGAAVALTDGAIDNPQELHVSSLFNNTFISRIFIKARLS